MIHVAPTSAVVLRRRRTVAVVVLAAVLVGLLALVVRLGADVVAPSGAVAPVPAGAAVTVVAPGETLLDVAARVAPGSERSAVAERIRDANHLSSALLTPGRPLVVPAAP